MLRCIKWDGGFQFFVWGNYGCLGFNGSPDDGRGGSKTVVFVEGCNSKIEILELIETFPFVKRQFTRLSEMYNRDFPKVEQFKNEEV